MPESLTQESALGLVRLAISAASDAGAVLAGRPAGRSETAILTALRELTAALGAVRLTGEAVTAIDSAAFDRGVCARARAIPDGKPALRLVQPPHGQALTRSAGASVPQFAQHGGSCA